MDLSPKKIEHIVKSEIMSSIEKMDRKTLNELYYLAVKQLEQTTKDYNKLLDEFMRNKQMDANDSEHIFTPRTYRGTSIPKGIIKKRNTTAQSTDTPDTTPSFNRDRMTWRFLGEDSYRNVQRPPTPPRKTTTRKGGKKGKYNKTMRK